ncbi:MAG: TonB-dependent receptor, partial [Spirochaetales bacterium]|nr:TonB-dependent receptor [Spirochaetales bacterium]
MKLNHCMKNNYLQSKVRWLKNGVFCLMIWPLSITAANNSREVEKPSTGIEVQSKFFENEQQQKNTRKIVGIVKDENDITVIGASILIVGTSTGTATDSNGRFSLEIPEKGATLIISYLGYNKKTFNITDQGFINVKLEPDSETLNEVIVVGQGVQKKISVTGAISNLEGKAMSLPSSSLTAGFAGKLAGVISKVSSGEPGSTSEFYIRGAGTFGGRATPLIILDGVEISAGDLDRIPAETIDSFSILKDASATAIYGARGANGVMVVTTKSGVENSPTRVNVTLENSLVVPTNMVEFVDGATWMEKYNEAQLARNPESVLKYSQDAIDMTRSGIAPYAYPDVDWYDLMFKDHMMSQRANVNISGGGSRTTYYMSVQGNHDTGMLDIPSTYSFDNNIDRMNYNFQSNIGYKLTSTTKLDLRLNAQLGTNKGPNSSTSDFFRASYNTNPVAFPAVFAAQPNDDHIRFGNAFLSGSTLIGNPYAQMLSNYKQEDYSTVNATISLNQDLGFALKGLKFKGLFNTKSWSQMSFSRSIDPYYYNIVDGSWAMDGENEMYELQRVGTGGNKYVTESGVDRGSDRTIYIDSRLDYSRQFGRHAVSAMVMYMQREFRSGTQPNRNQGISGRATYDFDNRYLFEFNFGYNGSERLPKGERFEFFPAASVGWVASGEEFWTPIKRYINFFKLRGSYGVVGSDDTGEGAGAPHYLYYDDVSVGSGGGFYLGDGPASTDQRRGPGFHAYAVENASWERVNKMDIGVDLELFNQIRIAADYFLDKREKILMKRAAFPKILGYSDAIPWSNVGKVDNTGFDMSVNWKTQPVRDLWVDLRFNYTYNKNKYVYVDEPEYPYVWKTQTGKPLNTRTGYICDGFFETLEEIDNAPSQLYGKSVLMVGDLKYRDVNGDGTINVDDKTMISP